MKTITTKIIRIKDRLFGCLAELSTQEQETYPIFDRHILARAREADHARSWVHLELKQSRKTQTVYIANLMLSEPPE